ncbi:hypothetical protein QJS10_CPA09g01660 [Acorus calamus]|uniref:Proline dehydrogenase n=1 Tax=Acorus calamus TaxID=4465 RepID=A0AAV9E603_ACOCL|nr:hypothetical protein QJS10_CPA09g01660 [Acorus calamus]
MSLAEESIRLLAKVQWQIQPPVTEAYCESDSQSQVVVPTETSQWVFLITDGSVDMRTRAAGAGFVVVHQNDNRIIGAAYFGWLWSSPIRAEALAISQGPGPPQLQAFWEQWHKNSSSGERLHMFKVPREGVEAPEALARHARGAQEVKITENLQDSTIRSIVQQNFISIKACIAWGIDQVNWRALNLMNNPLGCQTYMGHPCVGLIAQILYPPHFPAVCLVKVSEENPRKIYKFCQRVRVNPDLTWAWVHWTWVPGWDWRTQKLRTRQTRVDPGILPFSIRTHHHHPINPCRDPQLRIRRHPFHLPRTTHLLKSLLQLHLHLHLVSFDPLVNVGIRLMCSGLIDNPLTRKPLLAAVKATVNDHFCAGEDLREANRTLQGLWEDGFI